MNILLKKSSVLWKFRGRKTSGGFLEWLELFLGWREERASGRAGQGIPPPCLSCLGPCHWWAFNWYGIELPKRGNIRGCGDRLEWQWCCTHCLGEGCLGCSVITSLPINWLLAYLLSHPKYVEITRCTALVFRVHGTWLHTARTSHPRTALYLFGKLKNKYSTHTK